MLLLRKPLLATWDSGAYLSLERAIVPGLIAARRLRALDNGTRYFLDFGTPAALEEVTSAGFVLP